MEAKHYIIRVQTKQDKLALIALHEKTFGPGRFARTAYRVREGAASDDRLDLCLEDKLSHIIGCVQFTPISIGNEAGALLLGPIVIDEAYKNQGYGLKLMSEGLARAKQCGYQIVILIGDLPYYMRAGFSIAPSGRFVMPGPIDQTRLLLAQLVPNAVNRFIGAVRGAQKPIDNIVNDFRDTMSSREDLGR